MSDENMTPVDAARESQRHKLSAVLFSRAVRLALVIEMSETVLRLDGEVRRLRNELEFMRLAACGFDPAENLPEKGQEVIVWLIGYNGLGYHVRAHRHEVDGEWYRWCPHEESDEEPLESEPVHWWPMPSPPAKLAAPMSGKDANV